MGNDEFLEQLTDKLLEEAASNPTAEELEEFWSAPADTSPGTLERMRKQFVEKVFEKLHPKPVSEVEPGLTLGQWLEAARKKAHLTRSFIATALDETPSFIEQLEKGDILPWDTPASTGANISVLFQIHFTAFRKLAANSHKALEYLPNAPVKTKSHVRTSDALPLKSTSPDEMSGRMEAWLKAVHGLLEEKPAAYLLN